MRIAARQSWAKAVNRVALQMLCHDKLRRGEGKAVQCEAMLGEGMALRSVAPALTGFAMRRKGIAPPRAEGQQPGTDRRCGGKA